MEPEFVVRLLEFDARRGVLCPGREVTSSGKCSATVVVENEAMIKPMDMNGLLCREMV
jgi:hypothetical protein